DSGQEAFEHLLLAEGDEHYAPPPHGIIPGHRLGPAQPDIVEDPAKTLHGVIADNEGDEGKNDGTEVHAAGGLSVTRLVIFRLSGYFRRGRRTIPTADFPSPCPRP